MVNNGDIFGGKPNARTSPIFEVSEIGYAQKFGMMYHGWGMG
jgi:hypothetical protein